MNITQPSFDHSELQEVQSVLNSCWVTQGPKTASFEESFAAKHNVKHALATTSCTAALHLSALALELKPEDEVIVPAFTWVTSAFCVEYVGAKVVFADIDLSTFNISPAAFEAALTEKTKAVVVVHLFGKSAPMDEILRIARRHNVSVIEDAACAVGTTYNGRHVGSLGDIGCFSFHPRKVITTGEGGMVTTNSDQLALKIKTYRNHGATGPAPGSDPSKPYTMSSFDVVGHNLRLSDIQAAVGVAQLRKLPALLVERRQIALHYTDLLSSLSRFVCPEDDPGHTYQSYVIRLREPDTNLRNHIMDLLSENGIQTRPGTHSVPRLGFYSNTLSIDYNKYPQSLLAEDNTITLPIFPGMTRNQQRKVVDLLSSI